MDVLHMGLHATQIMGYTEIMNSYRFITKQGARTMQVMDNYGIAVGKPANFLIFNADNWYNTLNERAELLYSVHEGHILVETEPANVQVNLPD